MFKNLMLTAKRSEIMGLLMQYYSFRILSAIVVGVAVLFGVCIGCLISKACQARALAIAEYNARKSKEVKEQREDAKLYVKNERQ